MVDPPSPDPQGPEDPGIAALIAALAADARLAFEAEAAWWKLAVAHALASAKRVAILFALALALVFFALMALVTGSVIALAPVIGAWGATALVTLVLVLAAALAAQLAIARIRRTVRLLTRRSDDA